VCKGSDILEDIRKLGVVVHPFEYPKFAHPAAFLRSIWRMRKVIREGHYDCVVSHNRNASIIGRVAAWLERVPLNVYTAHGFYFHDGQRPVAKEVTVWIEKLLGRVTDFTLSQSQEDIDFSVRRGILRRDKALYIANGIDTKKFSPRRPRIELEKELGFSTGKFRICSTGRIVRGKGFNDLLEAFARFHASVKNSELVLIGGTISHDIWPAQKEFLERVAELGLQKEVIVTGLTENVQDYLGVCDLFVLPSYREGLSRSMLEALSMGLPVAATRIRGCREVIVDGTNGFLFEPRDVDGLSALIMKLHGAPEVRRYVGVRGRETAVSTFDVSRYVEVQVAAMGKLFAAQQTKAGA
jgi:glycosyltransferase involved in cell wall biosynthesis